MIEPLNAVVFYLVFLFSTVLHEAAHAWTAMRGGDPTAYHGGQVSLDPRPHMRREPFGMIMLPLISLAASGWIFGYASAPYDPRWAEQHPKRAALMSLAGPASNLLLVLAAWIVIRGGTAFGWFAAPMSIGFDRIVEAPGGGLLGVLALVLSVIFSLNLLLAVFNLIPFPPLDGSGVLPVVLPGRAMNAYRSLLSGRPGLAWIGIIGAWMIFDRVFPPIWLAAVNLLYPGTGYG
ncbi:MAG: site-2 protease family protein [Gemmatimonadetes bacterium]|nr:site-2 protease family protein [Gemmatimonadota bacterium]